jgi:hypothetical protein
MQATAELAVPVQGPLDAEYKEAKGLVAVAKHKAIAEASPVELQTILALTAGQNVRVIALHGDQVPRPNRIDTPGSTTGHGNDL